MVEAVPLGCYWHRFFLDVLAGFPVLVVIKIAEGAFLEGRDVGNSTQAEGLQGESLLRLNQATTTLTLRSCYTPRALA